MPIYPKLPAIRSWGDLTREDILFFLQLRDVVVENSLPGDSIIFAADDSWNDYIVISSGQCYEFGKNYNTDLIINKYLFIIKELIFQDFILYGKLTEEGLIIHDVYDNMVRKFLSSTYRNYLLSEYNIPFIDDSETILFEKVSLLSALEDRGNSFIKINDPNHPNYLLNMFIHLGNTEKTEVA